MNWSNVYLWLIAQINFWEIDKSALDQLNSDYWVSSSSGRRLIHSFFLLFFEKSEPSRIPISQLPLTFVAVLCHLNNNWKFFTCIELDILDIKKENFKYLTKSSNLKRYFWCFNVCITDIMIKQRFQITYFCLFGVLCRDVSSLYGKYLSVSSFHADDEKKLKKSE